MPRTDRADIPRGADPHRLLMGSLIMVNRVVIGREEDTAFGWAFVVLVQTSSGERAHQARMSWVDYEHWSGGGTAPAAVVEACLATVLEELDSTCLPPSFDLSTLRRMTRNLDEAMRRRLGRGVREFESQDLDERSVR